MATAAAVQQRVQYCRTRSPLRILFDRLRAAGFEYAPEHERADQQEDERSGPQRVRHGRDARPVQYEITVAGQKEILHPHRRSCLRRSAGALHGADPRQRAPRIPRCSRSGISGNGLRG